MFDGECEEVRHELGIDSTVSGYSDKGPAMSKDGLDYTMVSNGQDLGVGFVNSGDIIANAMFVTVP